MAAAEDITGKITQLNREEYNLLNKPFTICKTGNTHA
jgi:hypothetical protein